MSTEWKPFTAEEHRQNVQGLRELQILIRRGGGRDLRRERDRLTEEYAQRLPIIELSRCPYCNNPLHRRFDPFDLNGPWWEPLWWATNEPPVCSHFFVLQGALNLNGLTPSEVQNKDGIMPGPEVPFVIARLLRLKDMVAVIHSLSVAGRYTAYPIAYFARQRPPQTENTQTWCRSVYELDEEHWDIRLERYDYDLMRWIRRGKVFWLDANDPELPLARGPKDKYPYRNIQGRQYRLEIRLGQIGSREPPPPYEEGEHVNHFQE